MRSPTARRGQRKVQERLCLLPAHAWEPFEEIIKRIPGLQMSEQGAHGHAGAGEHGTPPRMSGSSVTICSRLMAA